MRKDRDKAWAIFALIAALVVIVMVLGAELIWWIIPQDNRWFIPQDNWSTFAEVYGAVIGTFFAGLAFAGLVLSIHLQRRELKETREELKRTADAQVESQRALEAQVEVAQLTARLNAATALLEHYRSIHIDRPTVLSDEDLETYLQREQEKAQNIKSVLDEITGLKSRLVNTVEAGPVRMEGTANVHAQGNVIKAGSRKTDT